MMTDTTTISRHRKSRSRAQPVEEQMVEKKLRKVSRERAEA